MSRPPRAFIMHPYGPSQPVKKLKFAVVNDDNLIVSAVWTVFPAHNPAMPDIYVSASGMGSAAKFYFHGDVLNHSILNEAYERLVARGVVNTPTRHQQSIPITRLPFHGLTLRLVPEFMSKKGHSAEDFNGTIVALPVPPTGSVMEIGFFLAQGNELNIKGAQAGIGQVVSGGRALVVALAVRQLDVAAHKAEIDRLVAGLPVPAGAAVDLDPDADLGAMFYGEEQGFLTVTEVHNIRYRPHFPTPTLRD